jgi:hypothetical protein
MTPKTNVRLTRRSSSARILQAPRSIGTADRTVTVTAPTQFQQLDGRAVRAIFAWDHPAGPRAALQDPLWPADPSRTRDA